MQTRHVAHIVIEADTPLKVGSNASDFLQDSPIQKDFNGLPMILGTSIAGVLRKDFNTSAVKEIFGDENGSKVIISNAMLLDENAVVHETLLLEKSPFLHCFDTLPIREHVAITDKGVAKEHAKFDEEVLYKGTRFKFSVEVIDDEKESFEEILALLQSASFRIGGGSTKGFGKLKILAITTENFTLENYGQYSSSLNHSLTKNIELKERESQTHYKYTLNIQPEDFFIFGSGFGDEETDSTPVYERVVDYKHKKLSEKQILIPASSIKGALAHRTTYHYNLQNKFFVGNDDAQNSIQGLFGQAKDSKDESKKGSKGKVIFSDCFKENKNNTKIFDHVSIDRFTGGALEGALFQEKTLSQKDMWEMEILLEKNIDEAYVKAFESALSDVTTGMLPLGGMTTKGHGIFVGTWSKTDEKK